MKRIPLLLMLAALLFSNAMAGVVDVDVVDNAFEPASFVIAVGDTVRWTVSGSNPHTTTSTAVPTGASNWDYTFTGTGDTYIYVVTTAGDYSYNCTFHAPSMAGNFKAVEVMTIAEVIEDLNMDFVPDHLGDTVAVQGVVYSPNYQTSNNSFYIYDGTAGTDIFMFGPPVLTFNSGDMLSIVGEVEQFNGVTEVVPFDETYWMVTSTGNPTPSPEVITLAQYKANPEMYEGSLVGFVSLTLVSGTWPGSGSSANLSFSDGADTVVFRIDSDTDIDGQPEPTWPQDIIGIGAQFDNSAPYNGGYQIFPRYYATDFLPPGTIPVELTSFTASVTPSLEVVLNWKTATETNNRGFEIERKSANNSFRTIGFVQGNGTTSEEKNYSYVDKNLKPGTYVYRLKQIDFNGKFEYSQEIETNVSAPLSFKLDQNYPNPFNPSTKISFSVPKTGNVSLKVYNVLGQEVSTLINGVVEAGNHSVDFNAAQFNSGIYFYKIEAGNFSQIKKMTLIK